MIKKELFKIYFYNKFSLIYNNYISIIENYYNEYETDINKIIYDLIDIKKYYKYINKLYKLGKNKIHKPNEKIDEIKILGYTDTDERLLLNDIMLEYLKTSLINTITHTFYIKLNFYILIFKLIKYKLLSQKLFYKIYELINPHIEIIYFYEYELN